MPVNLYKELIKMSEKNEDKGPMLKEIEILKKLIENLYKVLGVELPK